jgi:hypothetical protein
MSPKRLVIRVLGLGMTALGVTLSGWIAYTLFINATPEFAGAGGGGRSSFKALIFGVAIAGVGLGLLRHGGKSAPGALETRFGTETCAQGPQAKVLDGIRTAAMQGKKIEAIKQYRSLTGAGLAESKQAVEELVRKAA